MADVRTYATVSSSEKQIIKRVHKSFNMELF